MFTGFCVYLCHLYLEWENLREVYRFYSFRSINFDTDVESIESKRACDTLFGHVKRIHKAYRERTCIRKLDVLFRYVSGYTVFTHV